MIALILMLSVPDAPQKIFGDQTYISGPGNDLCTVAWDASHANASAQWALGFWSGVNTAKGWAVGAGMTGDNIIAAVKKECAEKPVRQLFLAAADAYTKAARPKP